MCISEGFICTVMPWLCNPSCPPVIEPVIEAVPEFGTIGFGVLLGAVGLIVLRNKKRKANK